MKTFVINLPNANKRLESISIQLNNLHIPFEVFEAIYGKNLTNKELDKLYDEKKAFDVGGRGLTLGEIGCSLSHIGIFKKIVTEKIDIALVLEDDVLISKDIKKIYNSLAKNGLKYDYLSLYYENFDWDEIKKYFKYIFCNFLRKGEILKFIIHLFGMIFFSIIDHLLLLLYKIFGVFTIKKYKSAYSTCGYFISYEGARKLLSIHEKVFVPSDILPERYGKSVGLKFGVTIPRLLNPGVSPSCIDAIEHR